MAITYSDNLCVLLIYSMLYDSLYMSEMSLEKIVYGEIILEKTYQIELSDKEV